MKLKSILLPIIFISLSIFYPYLVNAQLEPAVTQNIDKDKNLPLIAEERKAKTEGMKNAFKEGLKTIKDERKKLLTEKINNRISIVNINQTERMKKALEKLTRHIIKLQEKIALAKEKGIDVSSSESAIFSAQTAISSALIIVEQQSAKDYTFLIINEESLGQTIRNSYKAFSQDLKNAQQAVILAKEAVVKAYEAVQTLIKVTPTVPETVAL